MSTKRKVPCWSCLKTALYLSYLFIFIFLSQTVYIHSELLPVDSENEPNFQHPTVVIAILTRNKAHTLPWFFGSLENLDYPKNRISLWIRSDHNADNTTSIIHEWLTHTRERYHNIDFVADDEYSTRDWNLYNSSDPPEEFGYEDETSIVEWSDSRIGHVLSLRQQALEYARDVWADYILYTDVDNFLLNQKTLQLLMALKKTIVAPMLNTTSAYSNFWCGMSERGFYQRTPDYFPIIDRQKKGCFPVPMVHSMFLIDLRHDDSLRLQFLPRDGYDGPYDDIIVFALNAKFAGVQMHVVNTVFFGYMLQPNGEGDTLYNENERFIFLKGESWIIGQGVPLLASPHVKVQYPMKDKMSFDQVYMINLVRRPERRRLMLAMLQELGIDVKVFDAVDGKKLNESYLEKLGVKQIPGFADPYDGSRPMTMGEIGCFLSHYFIWEDIVKNGYQRALLFEDDVRFEAFFRRKIQRILNQLKESETIWDLVYVGRKRLVQEYEPEVHGAPSLVYVGYSYWTLSYMLSIKGAKKLLGQKPLEKMIPVDEYLPIMFNRHPREEWFKHFEPRDLIAFSAEPMLVFPTHYTGEAHYISDTEDSTVISDKLIGPTDDRGGAEESESVKVPEPRGPESHNLFSHDEL